MKLEEFMGTLQPNEMAIVTITTDLRTTNLRAVIDADDEEGWVEVPDLVTSTLSSTPASNPFENPSDNIPEIEIKSKRLTGKVEFKKVRREKKE